MTNGFRIDDLILLFSFQGTKYSNRERDKREAAQEILQKQDFKRRMKSRKRQARSCVGDFAADKAREQRGAECTKVHEHRRMRAATQSDGKSTSRKSGDNSEEVTPVPISNTVVKLLSADDTWWEAAWESRTLPVFYFPVSHGIAILRSKLRAQWETRACVFWLAKIFLQLPYSEGR